MAPQCSPERRRSVPITRRPSSRRGSPRRATRASCSSSTSCGSGCGATSVLQASINHTDANGPGYPFSLAEKLARITEPHPWYTPEGGANSPWGRAILPMEMISVLSNKVGTRWPVRGPALGLFLDLEIRLVEGPVFVDQTYTLEQEVAGLSQSRRTESYWTRTTITDADTGRVAAVVLLHSGVFKESYADYPKARLGG